jgi:hypothetical protein
MQKEEGKTLENFLTRQGMKRLIANWANPPENQQHLKNRSSNQTTIVIKYRYIMVRSQVAS